MNILNIDVKNSLHSFAIPDSIGRVAWCETMPVNWSKIIVVDHETVEACPENCTPEFLRVLNEFFVLEKSVR